LANKKELEILEAKIINQTTNIMIQIKNLSKVFRTEEVETTALNEVSITINQGEFVTIMGASGSGKSTLLNIVGLLDNASSGNYQLLNQEIIGLKEQEKSKVRKQNIGFIFQNFNLIDELSVYDNIELPLIYNNVPSSERKKKVEIIAERLGISHRLKHYPQQLSGGQQQRVAVARALINDPKIILADEPTGNLDSKNGNEVMELLTDLHAQGSTILMVTHSDYDASFSQRTIFMKDGMIVSEKNNSRNVDILINKQ
jgi:putative ABC transport system ATP-binding protein